MHITRKLAFKKIALIAFLFFSASGFAQAPLPQEAMSALRKGQMAASLALANYESHHADKPLWKEAISFGLEAQQYAPDQPEPYRFLGQAYTTVKWYSRAWDAWQTYLKVGGQLNAQTAGNLEVVSRWLGNNSYNNRDYQQALTYYKALLMTDPQNEEGHLHIALSYIALSEPELAQDYLIALSKLYPEDFTYVNLLQQTQEQITYGVEASQAFQKGREHYSANRLEDALLSFEQASKINADFRDAFVWAGRISLELQRTEQAFTFWQRAVALDPSDQEALENLNLAKNQTLWGIDAYSAYQQGLDFVNQGQLNQAVTSFTQATSLNDNYGDAWGWLGQLAFNNNQYQEAVGFYAKARSLVPENASYENAYQQAVARQKALERQADQAQEPTIQEEPPVQTSAITEATTDETGSESIGQDASVDTETDPSDLAIDETIPPESELASPPRLDLPVPPTTLASSTAAPTPTISTTPSPNITEAIEEATPQPQAISLGSPIELLDLSFTHTSSTSSGKGAFSFFSAPSPLFQDLTAPISYSSGTIYQRLEVLNKPSDKAVRYQLCLVPNDEINVKPACSNESTLAFSEPGVYESTQSLTSFSQYGNVDWAKGVSDVILIIKDDRGNPLDHRYFFDQEEALNLQLYYPMQVRYEAIIVPAGSSFSGW